MKVTLTDSTEGSSVTFSNTAGAVEITTKVGRSVRSVTLRPADLEATVAFLKDQRKGGF